MDADDQVISKSSKKLTFFPTRLTRIIQGIWIEYNAHSQAIITMDSYGDIESANYLSSFRRKSRF